MIGEKIINIMKEIEPIVKTEQNEGEEFKTAKVEKIISMVQPLLIKNKVIIVPVKILDLISEGNKVFVKMLYQFIDVGDNTKELIEVEVPGEGYDEKGRAVYAALTGAYRYAIQQVFAIPIVDEIKIDQENKSIEQTDISNLDNVTNISDIQGTNEVNQNLVEGIQDSDIDNLFKYKSI